MNKGKRRSFLKKLSFFLTSLFLYKIPITALASIKNPKKTSFYKAVLSRYHNWHNQNYFNFGNHLSSTEKQYVELCQSFVSDWTYKLNQDISLSYITYSHRIKGDKANSSRLACGTFPSLAHSAKLQNEMLKIIKERGIILPTNIPNDRLIGLGWDFEADHFKYYYLLEFKKLNVQQQQIARSQFSNLQEFHPMIFYSKTYKGNKEHEEKVYLQLGRNNSQPKSLNYPKQSIKNTTAMITNKRGLVPQYDLINYGMNSKNDLNKLFNEKGREIINENKDFVMQEVYTVNYTNPDDFTVYFF